MCIRDSLYISQNTNNHKQAHIAQFNSIINLSDFDLHVIFFRRNNLMVKQLFLGMQCSSCGERFPKSHKKQYSDHLDWHFRENKKEKEGGKKVISRSWYFELVVSIFLLCHSLNLLILKDLINKIFPIVWYIRVALRDVKQCYLGFDLVTLKICFFSATNHLNNTVNHPQYTMFTITM